MFSLIYNSPFRLHYITVFVSGKVCCDASIGECTLLGFKRLDGMAIDAASLNDVLTDTLNRILLEDVEDFIQTHMKVWKCDRLTVEFQVAKAIAEIYPRQES